MDIASDDRAPLAAWIRLTLVAGLGSVGQRKLLKAFGSPEAVFAAPVAALATVVGAELAARIRSQSVDLEVETTFAWAGQPENHLVPLDAPDYPAALLELPDPPNLLYCKGDLARLGEPGLAVVGSRNPTVGGTANGERFARTFADYGYTIVSGLALGIDSAAHRGALSSERPGATIAVVGTGLDRVYPARNQPLAREIVAAGGLMVSELPLGAGPLPHHFPRRNRIIAALARGVVVVEATPESGSLITARLGADLGREVFALPGSIHSPLSRGCHQLIKDGAKLVETPSDVLEELPLHGRNVRPAPAENAVAPDGSVPPVLAALGGDPLTVDELGKRCGLTADCLLAMLLELELAGRIAALPGGRYQRLD